MVPNLYNSLLSERWFKAARRRLEEAAGEDRRKACYPVIPSVLTERLSVSFPVAVGLAMYDLETAAERVPVGKAYAIQHCPKGKGGLLRYGVIQVVLIETPIFMVARGSMDLELLEIFRGGEFLGGAELVSREDLTYSLWSSNGRATLQRKGLMAFLMQDETKLQFSLQCDREYIPWPRIVRWRAPKPNLNIIHDPSIKMVDPLVVMSFLLATRMVYLACDF